MLIACFPFKTLRSPSGGSQKHFVENPPASDRKRLAWCYERERERRDKRIVAGCLELTQCSLWSKNRTEFQSGGHFDNKRTNLSDFRFTI